MRRTEWAAAGLALALYLLARGPGELAGPFVLPFETAFQEAIAIHHLDEPGIAGNGFLSVLARLDGRAYHHTAHPPLLQIFYALAYKTAGGAEGKEWISRAVSIILIFASALLWRALMGKDRREGWAVVPLALFAPVVFILGATTNYEPLSIFFISLLAWLALERRAGLPALLSVLPIGLFVDWPVYLAVPALLALRWRESGTRKHLLILLGVAAVVFTFIQAWQITVAGEAAFFGHAPERANPLGLLSPATWTELFGHYFEIMGTPAGVLGLVGIAACVGPAVRALKAGEHSGKDGADGVAAFFLVFAVLLTVSAPGLLSRHYVHLLYLAPAMVLGLHRLAVGKSAPRLALLAALVLFAGRDIVLAEQRNPAYHAMAERVEGAGIEEAFASSAVGVWRFYAGIETGHPVSAAMSEWIEDARPGLLHLDLKHREVASFIYPADPEARGRSYRRVWRIPGEAVFVKRGFSEKLPRYLDPPEGLDGGPGATNFVMSSALPPCRPGAASSRECSDIYYAVSQHPGADGSMISAAGDGESGAVRLLPGVIHPLPWTSSDGVTFTALTGYHDEEGRRRTRLGYCRFVADSGRPVSSPAAAGVVEAGPGETLVLVTLPGPWNNPAFDDAYWLEPEIVGPERER